MFLWQVFCLPSQPKQGRETEQGTAVPTVQPIIGHSPAGSDSPAIRFQALHKTLTVEPAACPCLHTSSLLPRARSSAFIRSKKQSHQSGWAGAIADTSLGSFIVEQLCLSYKLLVHPDQLSTSQLSAFQGPAHQNWSITALVTALWKVLFWENGPQPPQISWIWLVQRQAVQEQLQAVSAEWRFPHP